MSATSSPVPSPPASLEQTFELIPCRRPKDRVRVQLSKYDNGGFKTHAHYLIEALGGKWTRRNGYTLSPLRAEAFAKLYRAGFHGSRRIFAADRSPPKFSLPQGEEMSLKAALQLAEEILAPRKDP